MPLYRKKPVYVEAVQFHVEHVNNYVLRSVPLPTGIVLMKYTLSIDRDRRQTVKSYHAAVFTAEVLQPIYPGDWLIKESDGRLSVCKPDRFALEYQLSGVEVGLEDMTDGLAPVEPGDGSDKEVLVIEGDFVKESVE